MNDIFHTHYPQAGAAQIVSAPGRVNLIGEHTDYNEGFVLPMTLPLRTTITFSPNGENVVRAVSETHREPVEFPIENPKLFPRGHWGNYLIGIFQQLQESGISLRGLNAVIGGNLPPGAGVSSSAALLVAFGKTLLRAAEEEMPALALAKLCRRAEHSAAGANVGIMDMLVSALDIPGKAVFLDCRNLFWRIASPLPGMKLVVLNTGVKHELASNAYNTRVEECRQAVEGLQKIRPSAKTLRDGDLSVLGELSSMLEPIVFKRARHVISENERTRRALICLDSGDANGFAGNMNQSHESLREDYEVSCKELDDLVESAREHPACLASRMTGGGFGGCTVSLVRENGLSDFILRVGQNKLVSAV